MANWFQKQWSSYTAWHILLLPLSAVFYTLSSIRKFLYQTGWLKTYRLPVPVIVVGNINVGGTGKTPLVIWLADQLKRAGYQPGIMSRGYGGSAQQVQEVYDDSLATRVGDEPVLIAKRTGIPVFIHANRVEAGKALLKAYPNCNIIISDDGLQHYRLQRDVELAAVDGAKGFGNRALLPAGPLREQISRLALVDAIISNGELKEKLEEESVKNVPVMTMHLKAGRFYNLADNASTCDADAFVGKKVVAVAGIGNPQRFFEQLQRLGINFEARPYADHRAYIPQDFQDISADIVLMTEKDAVKCQSFGLQNCWVLPVDAVVEGDLMAVILNKLRRS